MTSNIVIINENEQSKVLSSISMLHSCLSFSLYIFLLHFIFLLNSFYQLIICMYDIWIWTQVSNIWAYNWTQRVLQSNSNHHMEIWFIPYTALITTCLHLPYIVCFIECLILIVCDVLCKYVIANLFCIVCSCKWLYICDFKSTFDFH